MRIQQAFTKYYIENQESIHPGKYITFSLTKFRTSMNAKVHNDCDSQFVQAIQILNKYFDDAFDVIIFAKNLGGIKDFHSKIVIKDPLLLIILTALLTSSTQQFFTSNFTPSINVTGETKNKLDNIVKIKELIKSGSLTDEEFEYITSNDVEFRKLKSNFYKPR